MTKRRFALIVAALTLLSVAGSVTLPVRAADLDSVMASFDEAQRSFRALSAEFTEVTTNPLFKDPIRGKGQLYMTKPNSIRWEYESPERMRFVIANDIYTGYFPDQKRAEKRNIQRYSKHLFRMFGVGQGSAELLKFYEIERRPEGDTDDALLLVMSPRKKRARKRVDEVHFWVHRSTFLPAKIHYLAQDGGGRTVEFQNVMLDPDLAAGLYEVEIPADVEVTKGFSGLPDFSATTQ